MVGVAVIVMVRIASLLCNPLISFWAPVLRTFTSKLIFTFGSAAGCWRGGWLSGLLLFQLCASVCHRLLDLIEGHHGVGLFLDIDVGDGLFVEIDDLNRLSETHWPAGCL